MQIESLSWHYLLVYVKHLLPKAGGLFLVWATLSYKHLFIRNFEILRSCSLRLQQWKPFLVRPCIMTAQLPHLSLLTNPLSRLIFLPFKNQKKVGE